VVEIYHPHRKRGNQTMHTALNTFATVKRDGVIQTIGRSTLLTPVIKYDGRTTKWYEDKPKQRNVAK